MDPEDQEQMNNSNNHNNHIEEEEEEMNVEGVGIPPASLPQGEEDDDGFEDEPAFIDMNDAVEVAVDDDDVPMDDDDDDDIIHDSHEPGLEGIDGDATVPSEPVVDMSQSKIESHSDAVYSVACHVENGKLFILSGGGDDKSYLHQIVTSASTPSSQLLAYQHTDTVSCVALNLAYVSEDLKKTPRLAATGSYDGSIILYDPDTAQQKLKLEGPSDIEWMAFHPKGGSVLLAGSGDGTVWMFHIPLNRCLQVFVGHEQAVTAGCFSPDGKWALSASADGTLRVWAPKTGMNKHVFRTGEAGLTCLANNGGSDGMLVMVGAEDGHAHVCHIGTKKVIATLRHFEVPPNAPTTHDDDDDDDEEVEMEYPMSVEAVGFFPAQPNWCATGGVDGKLKIWDLTMNGQCRQICALSSSQGENATTTTDSITRLRWHPTLPLIFTTTISGKIRLWDARTGGLLTTLTGHMDVINEADFFFNENGSAVIVSGGDDKTVRVFEVDVHAILAQQSVVQSSA